MEDLELVQIFLKHCTNVNIKPILYYFIRNHMIESFKLVYHQVPLHENEEYILWYTCYCNAYQIFLFLLEKDTFQLQIKDNYIYKTICKNGNMIMLDKLLQYTTIPLNSYNDYAYLCACRYGHSQFLKYLILKNNKVKQIKKCVEYSVYYNHYKCFKLLKDCVKPESKWLLYCTRNNNLHMLKDLVQMGVKNLHYKEDIILWNSIKNNNIKMVKYILSLDKFDIHKDNDMYYQYICSHKRKEMKEYWLSLQEKHGKIHNLILQLFS